MLRYDRGGRRLLLQAVKAMRLEREINFIRNNIDHYSGATFGCHENYLVRRAAPLTEANVHSLLAFLTLRMLYVSAGRVGATLAAEARGEMSRAGQESIFQISQRADYINNDLFEWVQFNRAIINTRDEPLADAAQIPPPAPAARRHQCPARQPAVESGHHLAGAGFAGNELPAQDRAGRRRGDLPQLVPSTRRPVAGAAGGRPIAPTPWNCSSDISAGGQGRIARARRGNGHVA